MKLKQKQGSRRREFELVDEKLYVKTKSWGENEEYSIDIEFVGEERYYKRYSRVGARVIGLVFYALAFLVIIGFLMEENLRESSNIGALVLGVVLMGGLGSLAFFAPLRNELYLVGGSANVMFLLNSSSEKEMETFINELIRRSKHILLEKYSKIDPDLSEETQVERFFWLKERGLISEEKYESLKEQYKRQRLLR